MNGITECRSARHNKFADLCDFTHRDPSARPDRQGLVIVIELIAALPRSDVTDVRFENYITQGLTAMPVDQP